ncbi:MAG: ATP synthase F1 subunit epsilon [Candidatus Marinimicrobia bacterium]|nr:ATP synthase F1 subunit epsilon [Candidatus Neomarinimicrobiota bacterium]|tara:strand:- start:1232 stop:1630 length:399 start_codon:yes stop_codon:yes gene_type:complete
MSDDFSVEIITPISQLDMGNAEYLRLPGMSGLIGVMKNHASALISLGIGEIKIENSENTQYLSTSGGVLDFKNNKAQLLLESVEKASDIDIERAKNSQNRAKERLRNSESDKLRAEISLLKALNRLKVGNRS